jgi:glucose-1-phosphate cytidylyltransferase
MTVKTMILCGGQGTRMREETEFRPKPLVEIGGRPILWHIMKMYAQYGFSDFILCLGYRGSMIKEYFLSYEAMNHDFTLTLGSKEAIELHGKTEESFNVTLAETGLATMTGGRVRRAAQYLKEDDVFMLTYGDGVADVDLRQLVAFHKQHGKLATVTVVRPTSRFGVLDVLESGVVTQFAEKPQSLNWTSAGFFVLDRRVVDLLDGDECVFETGPLERLVAAEQLVAFRHDGFFFPMDTYREYLFLNQLWDNAQAPWKSW